MIHTFYKLLATCALFTAAVSPAVAEDTIFFDNVENGNIGWTKWGSTDGVTHDGGLWHISSLRAYSSSNSWYYGFENGNYYESLENMSTLASPEIDLTGYTNATLTLSHFLDTETDPASDFDMFGIYVIDEDGNDTLVFYSEGDENASAAWQHLTVDLAAHLGKKITIYVDAYTTSSCSSNCWSPTSPEGWYIENVKVVGNK